MSQLEIEKVANEPVPSAAAEEPHISDDDLPLSQSNLVSNQNSVATTPDDSSPSESEDEDSEERINNAKVCGLSADSEAIHTANVIQPIDENSSPQNLPLSQPNRDISTEQDPIEPPSSNEKSINQNDNIHLPTGIKIQTRLRSSLTLIFTFVSAVILTTFTIIFASTSFSQSLIFTPPFLPHSPENAILVLQILATVSLMMIRECFSMSCEILRWSMACRGTDFLSFSVLSESTGFWGVVYILITKPSRPFTIWRMLALYKFVILYIALLIGQFVWVLSIGSRNAYQIIGSFTIERSDSMAFNIWNNMPDLFESLDVQYFFDGQNQVIQIPPTICSPDIDLKCIAYALPLQAVVTGYLDVAPIAIGSFSNSSLLQIIYSVPGIITEFKNGTSNLLEEEESTSYCVNHTSASSGARLKLCLGSETTSLETGENSSIITAGWEYCYFCDISGYDNIYNTTMFISTASFTTILWSSNQSIQDTFQTTDRAPFPVDISMLLNAVTAPFDVETITNENASTILADEFVDSLSGYFQPSTLREFLTFALARNFLPNNFPHLDLSTANTAIQTQVLKISPFSVIGFTLVAAITLVSCIIMWFVYPQSRGPNISLYPEVTFAGKIDSEMAKVLMGLSNGTSKMVLKQLVDVKIKVGEQVYGGIPRVIISTTNIPPLQKDVEYS